MQAEEKKLKVLKMEIEASKHSDSAVSSARVMEWCVCSWLAVEREGREPL